VFYVYARARAHARADPAKRATQAPPPIDAHGALGTHTQSERVRPPQQQPPPCRLTPPRHMARRRTQSPAGNGPPVKAQKQAITATHRDPPWTLAAVRSPGTARHTSRATAPSTRTAKEARDWAIGGRHGEIRAGMCGLPHLPHDAQISDQRFTLPAFGHPSAPAPGTPSAARAVPPIPMAPLA